MRQGLLHGFQVLQKRFVVRHRFGEALDNVMNHVARARYWHRIPQECPTAALLQGVMVMLTFCIAQYLSLWWRTGNPCREPRGHNEAQAIAIDGEISDLYFRSHVAGKRLKLIKVFQ